MALRTANSAGGEATQLRAVQPFSSPSWQHCTWCTQGTETPFGWQGTLLTRIQLADKNPQNPFSVDLLPSLSSPHLTCTGIQGFPIPGRAPGTALLTSLHGWKLSSPLICQHLCKGSLPLRESTASPNFILFASFLSMHLTPVSRSLMNMKEN